MYEQRRLDARDTHTRATSERKASASERTDVRPDVDSAAAAAAAAIMVAAAATSTATAFAVRLCLCVGSMLRKSERERERSSRSAHVARSHTVALASCLPLLACELPLARLPRVTIARQFCSMLARRSCLRFPAAAAAACATTLAAAAGDCVGVRVRLCASA